MHLQINRRPPPIEDVVRRMKARIDRDGWRPNIETISAPREACSKSRERSERSRRHCHLPAEPKKSRFPANSAGYRRIRAGNEGARIDNDRNLTDGARLCGGKVMGFVHRKNRAGRAEDLPVSDLKALGRCRRSVQGYLRELEREGYIEALVVPSERTRMCFGLLIRLLDPLFPRHRRDGWPEKGGIPDAQKDSQIYSSRSRRKPIPRRIWAFFCCEGVWRSYMKTLPPPPPFPITV